ncbi:MAG TPA: IS630 family transposase [Methylocella sp.]|nr:IS630 family transposase [Methylocella sp.]
MPKPYSQDLRNRVIDAVEEGGMSCRAAARRYEVNCSTAIKWLERYRREGLRGPVGHGGHRPSALMPHREFLEAARAEKSDVTLQDLCDRLSSEKGVKADTSMMSRFFRKIGVTLKKTLVAREQDRADISRHRTRWRTYQRRIDPARLVFIDETWAKTNMTRLYGWAPRGKRLIDKVPHGHWNTATFLAALRSDRIEAPCLFDGPINGERFRAYVEQFLVPTLKAGDVVILDNLGSHKSKAVRKAIRHVGARLVFLPKYSPDLNPIEQVFAKFKTLLRKVGARTYEAISAACGEILKRFPPSECAAYLRNAGYA